MNRSSRFPVALAGAFSAAKSVFLPPADKDDLIQDMAEAALLAQQRCGGGHRLAVQAASFKKSKVLRRVAVRRKHEKLAPPESFVYVPRVDGGMQGVEERMDKGRLVASFYGTLFMRDIPGYLAVAQELIEDNTASKRIANNLVRQRGMAYKDALCLGVQQICGVSKAKFRKLVDCLCRLARQEYHKKNK